MTRLTAGCVVLKSDAARVKLRRSATARKILRRCTLTAVSTLCRLCSSIPAHAELVEAWAGHAVSYLSTPGGHIQDEIRAEPSRAAPLPCRCRGHRAARSLRPRHGASSGA